MLAMHKLHNLKYLTILIFSGSAGKFECISGCNVGWSLSTMFDVVTITASDGKCWTCLSSSCMWCLPGKIFRLHQRVILLFKKFQELEFQLANYIHLCWVNFDQFFQALIGVSNCIITIYMVPQRSNSVLEKGESGGKRKRWRREREKIEKR